MSRFLPAEALTRSDCSSDRLTRRPLLSLCFSCLLLHHSGQFLRFLIQASEITRLSSPRSLMMSCTDQKLLSADHLVHGSQDSVITGSLNGPDPQFLLLRVR